MNHNPARHRVKHDTRKSLSRQPNYENHQTHTKNHQTNIFFLKLSRQETPNNVGKWEAHMFMCIYTADDDDDDDGKDEDENEDDDEDGDEDEDANVEDDDVEDDEVQEDDVEDDVDDVMTMMMMMMMRRMIMLRKMRRRLMMLRTMMLRRMTLRMMMLRRRKTMMLRMMMWGGGPIPRPRPTFCASCNRHAHGDVTRTILCGNLQVKAAGEDCTPRFVQAAIEMHMEMSQEPFDAEIYR